MTRIYEGMFLLDNDAVRAGWDAAKAVVTDLLEKHGGKAQSARRWDERKLAYPIKGRKRGTYLLAYYEIDPEAVPGLVRDLDISEPVLRYLLTRADAVPPKERELSQAEADKDFTVPEPPADDAPDPRPSEEAADAAAEHAPAARKAGEEKASAPDGEPVVAAVHAASDRAPEVAATSEETTKE